MPLCLCDLVVNDLICQRAEGIIAEGRVRFKRNLARCFSRGTVGKSPALMSFFSGCGRHGVFIDHRDDGIHPFLDLAYLRMHFFDQVMFYLGKFLDAFTLFLEPGQKIVLGDGNPAHPPKAKPPANHPGQRHPEIELIDIHAGLWPNFAGAFVQWPNFSDASGRISDSFVSAGEAVLT